MNFRILLKQPLLTVSSAILLLMALAIFLFPLHFYRFIEISSIWVREYFGKFYLWLGLICVLFLIVIAFSKAGRLKLGNTKPEFDRWSWIAMLYSAGMGAGILLRCVQEPVFMYLNNPINTGTSTSEIALEYTFYQWGFTAWAFYAVFALLVGYAVYIDKKHIQLGTSLPSFKKLSYLPFSIDTLTILTTVFGLVAAIGLGTSQIEGGIGHLTQQASGNLWIIMGLVFLICFIAFLSAWSGMHSGIKKISNWNIYLTILLLLFILVQGDLGAIFSNFFGSLYHYIIDFIPLSLALGNYDPGKQFLTDWTYYYWAFWLAWAPFTGIFIARISKGRTIRELIIGVLLIPSLGTFFWFSVFGTSAFSLMQSWSSYNNEFGNVFTSIFVFFEHFPLSAPISILTVILLISFLVTSVDSAIYVLSMFTSKGEENPKKFYRLVWALVIFVFSEAIIILGNIKPESDVLQAMQKFLIISSLPFALFTAAVIFLLGRKLLQKST